MNTDEQATNSAPNHRPAFRRRDFISLTGVAGVGVATAGATLWGGRPSAAAAATGQATAATPRTVPGMQGVEFDNNGITMAGDLYLPVNFNSRRSYPAIISVHPGGGVKEQTAGVYAQRLAEQGFVTLAFDASHQGASGGMPRYLDNPMNRVGDIYSAADYLTTLDYVDNDRIGILGICAGGGATIKATSTDRRFKAVATVSGIDVGSTTRKGWDGNASEADQLATLDAVAEQRTAQAAGAEPAYGPYVPALGDNSAPRDLQEAADYYLTPRGMHPNAPNRMLLTSASYMVAFTGYDLVETFLTQPLLIVAGSEAGSLWHSQELHHRAASTDKELVLIEGATHMDLYDGDGLTTAMKSLAPFYRKTL